ncbi:hypothetical protein J6590_025113 [Homalodisca vitripennis]|nr:hypothetical protein J6590_025113 [Homalodisca vitripennis]
MAAHNVLHNVYLKQAAISDWINLLRCGLRHSTLLTIMTLDFGSNLEIAQVQVLSVTVALFISTIDLVLYRLSPLFCLIRSSRSPGGHEGGQNKAKRRPPCF